MRKLVYYTTDGTKTMNYAEACSKGIVQKKLEEIPQPVYKADHRDVALMNLKLGITMV